ncbi:MAG TPA: DUF2723 domain-containing protein, partial [Caldilineaceae bacterium]|nr:DUF2723 domain-containing protein [Caldilineaceae bacterium]
PLAAGATVGLVFALARRLATDTGGRPNPWAGLAAALAFGLGPVWWSQATVAEVYTLHLLLVAGMLTAALGVNHLAPDARLRRVTLVALLAGLGLAHHRTILLTLPAVALYLAWSTPSLLRPQRAWLGWMLALLSPLLLYLYLPLRAVAGAADLHASYRNTWAGFWDHVLARSYSAFFAANPLDAGYTLGDWLALARAQLGWVGLGLALIGLAWLVDRRGRPARAWAMILLMLTLNFLFVLRYRVADPEVFALPVLLGLAIFTGGGVGLAGRLLPAPSAALLQAALVVALVFSPGRGPTVDRHTDWTAHDLARLMAATPFPPNSLVLGIEGEMSALRYMQAAEGLGRNATPLAADDPQQRMAAVEQALAAGRPTYLTRELAGIERRYSFSSEGALVRVWPRGMAQTPPAHGEPLALLDGQLTLTAETPRYSALTAQPWLEVALTWEPRAQLEQVLKLSFRLVDAGGAPLRWPDGRPVVEDRFPLRQVALTPDWLPGERVRDLHVLPVPPGAAQAARLQVIVYDSETLQELGRVELAANP